MYTLFYGFSADPVHQGHIDLVVDSVAELDDNGYQISLVLLVPVYRRNPVGEQPKHSLPTTYEHRFAMVELAANVMRERMPVNCIVTVSPIARELAQSSGGPNYDLATLHHVQLREAANTDLIYLMSAELVSGPDPEFSRWHKPVELARLTTIAIAPRPGYPPNMEFLETLSREGGKFVFLNRVVTTDISSSRIRARLISGTDPQALIQEGAMPQSIAEYIIAHRHLYSGANRARGESEN